MDVRAEAKIPRFVSFKVRSNEYTCQGNKHHALFSLHVCVCFFFSQHLLWSILVGHAAYSWGTFHNPELHIMCFRVQRCVRTRMWYVLVCGM